jgi:hypothetical protein
MRYKQRVVVEGLPENSSGVLWLGPIPADWLLEWPPFDGVEGLDPQVSDWYVTVDERVGAVLGVVATPWPTVNRTGALSFEGSIEAGWLDWGELQETVDGFRRGAGQVERPLRIGDTFWVRGYTNELQSPGAWEALLDVTAAARASAKVAVATVCVGDVEDPAAFFALDDDEVTETEPALPGTADLPPPAGPGVASPAV